MNEPRGIRNNNPTNIEYNANTAWQGLDTPPTDGRFCRFTEPQWGLRATLKIIANYKRRGVETVEEIISTWAPAADGNHVENYVHRVCAKTGLEPSSFPDFTDKIIAINFLKGMVAVECGQAPANTANGDWLDDAVYEAAWSLTKPITKSRTIRGSALTLASAAAGAVVQMATETIPQAADAANTVSAIWPDMARWVLLGVCIAGALLSFYARLDARNNGQR